VAASGQELAFEPMDYGPLLAGMAGVGTIGGVLAVAISAAVVEFLSPKGFDNLTVPAVGALVYWFLIGGH
jgi:dolichol kinase